jgi:hypothetical protein
LLTAAICSLTMAARLGLEQEELETANSSASRRDIGFFIHPSLSNEIAELHLTALVKPSLAQAAPGCPILPRPSGNGSNRRRSSALSFESA